MKSILIFFILVNFTLNFKCGVNKLKKIEPIEIESLDNKQKRKLETSSPIKIYADYKQIDDDSIMNTKIKAKIKEALNKVINLFSKIIYVKNTNKIVKGVSETNLLNFKSSCRVETSYLNLTEDHNGYDLILFPIITRTVLDSDTEAAAAFCGYEQNSKRPNYGFIYINGRLNLDKKNSDKYFKYLLLHELSHVLLFSRDIFNKFANIPYEIINNKPYITSPKVLAQAKKYFKCDSLIGVELENQGGSGSEFNHWESRVMLGDYMISSDYSEITLSEITLALFEDSGWYEVKYYTGGLFRFGKGEGCQFLTGKCIENEKSAYSNEFCDIGGEAKCTAGKLSKGICYITIYGNELESNYIYFPSNPKKGGFENANYCPISTTDSKSSGYQNSFYNQNCLYGTDINENLGEKIGSNSICVENSLTSKGNDLTKKATCFTLTCDFKNKKTSLTISSNKIECPSKGGYITNINNFDGGIMCPDFNNVCTSTISCSDLEDCVDKEAEPYYDTFNYDYIPDRNDEKLLENDENNEKEDRNNSFTIYLKLLSYSIILFLF